MKIGTITVRLMIEITLLSIIKARLMGIKFPVKIIKSEVGNRITFILKKCKEEYLDPVEDYEDPTEPI